MLDIKTFSYVLCGQSLMEKYIRHVCSGIEDLAFTIRRSRGPGRAGLRVCIEYRCMLTKMPGEKQSTMGMFTRAMV